MKVLGIDLAGSPKRRTGICLFDKKWVARCKVVFSDKEILEIVKKEKPSVVAIDAPLSLPWGRKSLDQKNKYHFRKADKELLSLKIKFFPLTLGPMRCLTKRGMRLKKILQKKKVRVIEVFPGATQDILGLPRKNKGKEKLYRALKRIGVKNFSLLITHDELDAICCALTGYLYLKGKTLALGEKKEGQIIVPRYGAV